MKEQGVHRAEDRGVGANPETEGEYRDGGEGVWSLIETPINYDINNDGYSQTMIPLGDGREILQLVSVNNRIAYAKFRLPEKLPQYAFPWGGAKTTDARRTED